MAFQKGVAANPNGRPKGALNKKTRFEQALNSFGEQHVENLLKVLYEEGLGGDIPAIKIFLEYVLPKADKRYDAVVEEEKQDLSSLTDAELQTISDILQNAEKRAGVINA